MKTFEDVITNYLKFKENIDSCSPHTLKSYTLDIKQIFNYSIESSFSAAEAFKIAKVNIKGWSKLSITSRNRKISTLKSFFCWIFERNLSEINYSDQLKVPKVAKKIPHFLSVDETIAIFNYLNLALSSPQEVDRRQVLMRQKTLFILLYGGGMRISEACFLKWKDIQFSEKKILIHGKGNKERYISLPNISFQHLAEFKKEFTQNETYVFGSRPLDPRAGFELVRKLGVAANLLVPLNPHALRHSYATHLLTSGANLRVLQSLLGHESLQATEKYTHLTVDHIARVLGASHPLSKNKSA